jgi:glutamate-1-semialdehyde 2,1-aminomutase
MSDNKLRDDYVAFLRKEYDHKFQMSRDVYKAGTGWFPNAISNPARLFAPFPVCIESAKGGTINTVEGEQLVDFWQGHFCNIMGHNPPVVLDCVERAFRSGLGLQLGLCTNLEAELASLLHDVTKMESFIFTTSGTLATMYAVMLGITYSGRRKVLKVAGGWHGAQPWSMTGVKYPKGIGNTLLEGAGIPEALARDVITIPFNDILALETCFQQEGRQLGVCIIELVLGNAGMCMAKQAWVERIRDLSSHYGVVLIFDEMVTGFRVNAGGLYRNYNVEPDLVTFGKAITGGMPFSCIAGKKDIIDMASTVQIPRVWADSGTFVSHPATLAAVIATIKFLTSNEGAVYPQLIANMNHMRDRIKAIFTKAKITVHITGASEDAHIPDFPISTIRFIRNRDTYSYHNALSHWDTETTDVFLRDCVCKLSLLLKGVHCWQGLGVMTLGHTPHDVQFTLDAYRLMASELSSIL